MGDPQPATVVYLLLVPYEAPVQAEPVQVGAFEREAPYFFDLDVGYELIGRRDLQLEGHVVSLTTQVLDSAIWLAECRFDLSNVLDPDEAARKHRVTKALKDRLLRELGIDDPIAEEYTILLLRGVDPSPDRFVDEHPNALVRLLRRLDKPLERTDATAILSHRARYSQDDLTVVDWEGAIIIAEAGDFDSDVELLKIGNYQLLRYRMLDRRIEVGLNELRHNVAEHGRGLFPIRRFNAPEIIEQRLSLLLDFDKIDQSLLLIGDWYSARVYRLIVEAFHLRDWKELVRAKLENLATIQESVQDRLSLSWGRIFDYAQLVGWMLLLIGYVMLFILEL